VEGSLETIINGIAKVAYEALNCDRVTIYFVDQTKEEIYCVVCKDVQGWCLPLGRGIAGYVGKTGQAVNVPNAYEDERFDPSWDQKTNYKTISVLCMPIKDSNGTTIAVIQALNKKATISPPSPSTPVLSSAPAPVPGSNSGTPATPTRSTRSASVPLVSSSSPYIPLSNWSLDSGAAPENKERERRQSVNDLSPLPLTTTTSGSGLVASSAAGSNALPASIIIPFTREDEEILEAFCHEISAVVRRYQTDALLELSQIRLGKEGMLPMVEMIPRPASSPSNGTANGNGNGKLPSSLIVAQGARAAFAERWSSELRSRAFNIWPDIRDSKLSQLNSLEFNVWSYSHDDLLYFTYSIFEEMGLIKQFNLQPDILKNFIIQVRQKYRDNPFHNWVHGFSAFHFCYLFLRVLSNAAQYLTPLDILGLMIAALCHDADHPGNTNLYEINSSSDLALIHNDQSVLENHHAYTCFSILRDPNANILAGLSRERFQQVRKFIIHGILHTDMSFHFEDIKILSSREVEAPFNPKEEKDRQLCFSTVLHSADLSGQVFPNAVARVWEERITREFDAQCERETQAGLPVAGYMQNLSDPVIRYKNQVNFIDFVLMPWWRSVVRIFPTAEQCFKNLMDNRAYYESMAAAAAAEKAGTDKDKQQPADASVTSSSSSSSSPSAPASTSASTEKEEGPMREEQQDKTKTSEHP